MGADGIFIDGFPGIWSQRKKIIPDPVGLDVYHGHTHATVDYPAGIYHYHFTPAAPYLNGNGFMEHPVP
jgi:hypothetical protein